jgi:hypothetical protein
VSQSFQEDLDIAQGNQNSSRLTLEEEWAQRARALEGVREGRLRVLLSTEMAARGHTETYISHLPVPGAAANDATSVPHPSRSEPLYGRWSSTRRTHVAGR